MRWRVEGMRLAASRLAGALSEQDNLCSLEKDDHVEEQGVILDVVEIELKLLNGIVYGRTIGIADLGPPRNSGFHGVSARVERHFAAELLHERGTLRTRTDETHVTAHDIDELGQFIDARQPNDPAHARNAVVVLLRPLGNAVLFGVRAHAAKLEDFEYLSGLAHSLLTVQNGPTRLEPDRQRSEKHHR